MNEVVFSINGFSVVLVTKWPSNSNVVNGLKNKPKDKP